MLTVERGSLTVGVVSERWGSSRTGAPYAYYNSDHTVCGPPFLSPQIPESVVSQRKTLCPPFCAGKRAPREVSWLGKVSYLQDCESRGQWREAQWAPSLAFLGRKDSPHHRVQAILFVPLLGYLSAFIFYPSFYVFMSHLPLRVASVSDLSFYPPPRRETKENTFLLGCLSLGKVWQKEALSRENRKKSTTVNHVLSV